MSIKDYDRSYFETIYFPLKKEKKLVLENFCDLLFQKKSGIKRILDLGCGEGEFLSICQDKGLDCFGVDISDYALKKAKSKIKGEFFRANLEKDNLPFPSGYFDAVTIFDTVEHLKNPQPVFKEVKRVLKRNGLFFLTTPNGGYIPAGFLGHFVMEDPTHVNLQGAEYWKSELAKAGFQKMDIKGCIIFGFPPSIGLRHFLRKLKFWVLTKPVFFPFLGLCSELFIFARKNEASLL